MKQLYLAILALMALGCGGEGAASAVTGSGIEAGEAPLPVEVQVPASRSETTSEQACDVLGSVLGAASDLNGMSWSYRPASRGVPQALCTATANPDGSPNGEVSLMIMKTDFESSAQAVESLEATVASLTEGLTITVGGRARTTQVDFEPFIEGVGDQAAWAPRLRELSVAHEGTRFAVTVRQSDDAAENKAMAIELARLVGDVL